MARSRKSGSDRLRYRPCGLASPAPEVRARVRGSNAPHQFPCSRLRWRVPPFRPRSPRREKHRRSRTGSAAHRNGRRNSRTLRQRSAKSGGGVELDARPHSRTDRHLLDEGALGPRWLGTVDGGHQRPHVLGDGVLAERGLADACMDDAGLLGAELDRACPWRPSRRRDVLGHRAELGVWHQAARTQHLTEPTHYAHHVGRRDATRRS